jgi:hypothetical protein
MYRVWTGYQKSLKDITNNMQISRQLAHEGGKAVSLMHRPCLPPSLREILFLVLISVRGCMDSKATQRLEGICQWKVPMTPSGIKPMTFQLVTPYLNQWCHCMPLLKSTPYINLNPKWFRIADLLLCCDLLLVQGTCLWWQTVGNSNQTVLYMWIMHKFLYRLSSSNLLSSIYEGICTWQTENQHKWLTSDIQLTQFQNILENPDLLNVQYSGNYEKCRQSLLVTWMCSACGATEKRIWLRRRQMMEIWEKCHNYLEIYFTSNKRYRVVTEVLS